MPPSIETVQSWQGRTMVDPAGDKLGTVGHLPRRPDQPARVDHLSTGLFGSKKSFVPLAEAQLSGDT